MDAALRSVRRELRRPRNLVRYLRKSGSLTLPLLVAGPTFVAAAYVLAFLLTPDDRLSLEFHAAASQIIPVLLLVLAVEGEAFRWRISRSAVTPAVADELQADERFTQFADGRGSVSDALEAVLDDAVYSVRNVADALVRQVTALLLLAALVVGEVLALVPLITDDPASASPQPVMAAIVGGFAGVAYVAVTGSRFASSE